MKKNVLLYSIILVFFLGVGVMPIINASCGNYDTTEFIPMCRMHTIGQISNNLDQYKQQTLAIVVKFFDNLVVIFFLIFLVNFIVTFKVLNVKVNIGLLKFKNISPWDRLKLALSQGIIHNKTLPNN